MGLIKAAVGALSGTLADQWKEYFYCESLSKDVLVARGKKQITSRSSNTKGNDNIISNGSGIAVADGQCMIIVEHGEIIEFCAETGMYTYDSSTEPSIFTGSFGEGIKNIFRTTGSRFTFGGDPGKDQRVYYFNTKEIIDNKFGTANPFMFRVVNSRAHMDRTVSVRCNGVYSYKITDPITFYKELCGNIKEEFTREEIDNQLKTDFISALQPAFAKLSTLELRPSEIPAHSMELEDAMAAALHERWEVKRGISLVSVSMNPITLTDEDLKKVQQIEDAAAFGESPNMMAGRIGDSMASSMEAAANNPNGAMMGFMGMNMAMQNGMGTVGNLYQQGQQMPQAAPAQDSWKCSCGATVSGNFCTQCGSKKPEPAAAWKCPKCGAMMTGNFCTVCGAKKPEADNWTCSCGTVNTGNFCTNCGSKKPAAVSYKCNKCGWEPSDPNNIPKFCPQCGDVFDENDKA